MAPKTYDCYVALRHVSRNGRIFPGVGAYRVDDPDYPNGWRDLVSTGTLAVWLVERTQVTHAKDLVLAHLAGHAPHGITQVYHRSQPNGAA